jgi:hypothetical protein
MLLREQRVGMGLKRPEVGAFIGEDYGQVGQELKRLRDGGSPGTAPG